MGFDSMKIVTTVTTIIFLSCTGSSSFADHTIVDNLLCVRDAGVITTTWKVADASEKYGGDLEVTAGFIAHCDGGDRPGRTRIDFHLSPDSSATYSYSCSRNTDDVSRCIGMVSERVVEDAVDEAVTVAAEALCANDDLPLLSVSNGEVDTGARVRHLQKGNLVESYCEVSHRTLEIIDGQSKWGNRTDQHSH